MSSIEKLLVDSLIHRGHAEAAKVVSDELRALGKQDRNADDRRDASLASLYAEGRALRTLDDKDAAA